MKSDIDRDGILFLSSKIGKKGKIEVEQKRGISIDSSIMDK